MRTKKKICIIVSIATALAASITAICLFLKRKRTGIFYALTVVALSGFMMGGAMTVYAAEETDPPDTEISEYDAEQGESVVIETITGEDVELDIGDFLNTEYRPNLLTPQGNLSLVDDFSSVQESEMQFITVQTRNGHYFYIIIDRVGERENVHFLNQVDEFSLLQILQGEDAEMPPLPPNMTITTPQVPTESDPNEANGDAQPQGNSNTGLLLGLLVMGAVGGGAFYYFKIHKPKQGNTKSPTKSELDEFDFEPDEDDLFSDNTDISGQDDGEFGGIEYAPDHDGNFDDDMPDFTAADEESEDNQ